MIRFDSVGKSFGQGTTRVNALRGVTLQVHVGEMCALMGPSGAGKSTVLHLAGGLTSVDAGTIVIGERDITRLSVDELTLMRRHDVGIIFQFFNLLPYLTAYENVALPLRLDDAPTPNEARRVEAVLDLVGMAQRKDHKPHELSGGEMQRVAVARALVIEPKVVLADEPTGNLDSASGRAIMDLLRDLNAQTRVTMLIVTHDPVRASVCDRVMRIVDGRIVEDVPMSGGSEQPATVGA